MILDYTNTGKILFKFSEEKILALSSIKIGKWLVWPSLKVVIFYQINKNPNYPIKKRKTLSFVKKIVWKIFLSLQLFVNFFLLIKKRNSVVFFSFTVDKHAIDNNVYINALMDPLIKHDLVKKYLYIEVSHGGRFKTQNMVKYHINAEVFSLPMSLVRMGLVLLKIHMDKASQLYKLTKDYFTQLGVNFAIDVAVFHECLCIFHSEYIFYSILWRIIKPKLIIVSDQVSTGKVAAALSLGIKVIDIQHGLMDEYYPSYIWPKEFLRYRNNLPFPSCIATFGQYHSDFILKHGFWKPEEVIAVGSYRVNLLRDKIYNTQRDHVHTYPVLYATQWHVFEHSKNMITNLIHILTQSPNHNIRILIKPHPLESEENVSFYKSVSECYHQYFSFVHKNKSVYDILPEISLVFGYDTTLLLEAIAAGIPAITISSEALPGGIHDFMNTSIFENVIKIARNENDLFHYLLNVKDERCYIEWSSECKKQGEFLFRSDYVRAWKELLNNTGVTR